MVYRMRKNKGFTEQIMWLIKRHAAMQPWGAWAAFFENPAFRSNWDAEKWNGIKDDHKAVLGDLYSFI